MKSIYKLFALAAMVLTFCSNVFSQQVAKSIPYPASPDGVIGFLQFTPSDYGTQQHPLIIFLHGIGERGNGTSQIQSITANAIPKFCAAGASMRFTVNGQTSSFVVLSPQLSVQYGAWPTFYVHEMIKYAKANLQIDTNRIYVCGLSLGGGGIWDVITEAPGGDYSFDGTIAAAAPVCGTQEENDASFCNTIGGNHLPVWAFHSMDDGTVNVAATEHAQILSSICGITSPAPIFTYYQSGGHVGAWLNAYDTGHLTVPTVANGNVVSFTQSPNLYEWFLSHSRASAVVAIAGLAQTINATATNLNAAGSYSPNGAIATYSWQQAGGPSSVIITNATSITPTVSNLIDDGTYSFKVTVTDVMGASASALTNVNVALLLLPVKLNYFNARKTNAGNLLQWETVSEQNTDYFAIERSADGNQFTDIDKVSAANNSTTAKDYTYTDANATSANTYYRLRQVDKNGNAAFSSVIMISDNASTLAVQMYPNPVQNNLSINFNNDVKGNGKITVYEITGRTVVQQTIAKDDKVLNAVVNMNNLAPGLYIVEVKIGDGFKFTNRILKK
jgi:poly(3-hydroxybutyrate) depolymerase